MKTARTTAGTPLETTSPYVCPLWMAAHMEGCGGKAANLGRMLDLGLPVPPGLVVTDHAFQEFLDANGLRELIAKLPKSLETSEVSRTGLAVRQRIMAATIPEAIRDAIDDLLSDILPEATLIVRSSAVGEDAARASFAGQLDSFLHIAAGPALHEALLACWASYWSERSLFYQRSRGVTLNGMGVVIQELVRSKISGVLFTRNPDPAIGGSDDLVVEYCLGHGDALVSGQVNPGRIVVSRRDSHCRRLTQPEQAGAGSDEDLLDDAQVATLVRAGLKLEEAFGGPQDIEWTIPDDGQLYLVQSRPITVPSRAAPGVTWSNANINENFPEPVSPLLYSIASAGYYHYFRNLGQAFGVANDRLRAMEHPLRHLIGVHGARLYYNLTNIHAVLRLAPRGDLLTESFNTFVGATQTPEPPRHGVARPEVLRRAWLPATTPFGVPQGVPPGRARFAEVCRIALRTTWQFSFLSRRVAAFEQTADNFAARTAPALLETRPLPELLDDFRAFLDIRMHRWTNASLADAAAMISYGLLKRVLNREFPAEDLSALHNTLLKGLPDVVSSVPVTRLWELSRKVRADPALAALFATEEDEALLAQIRTREPFAGFCAEFDAYLEQWGFRCSGELMLTVASFQEDPAKLLEILRAYVGLEGDSPLDLLKRQDAERRVETARVLTVLKKKRLLRVLPWPFKAWLVRLLLKWTHKAIALRERARLKQALLYSRCRRIVLAIGSKLVPLGYLEDARDVFYLTYEEIDSLLAGSAMFPYQVKELVRLRRNGHSALGTMRPPDAFELAEGSYLPLDGQGFAASELQEESAGQTLSGVGACGGRVTARAAVLQDVTEFRPAHEGDVLVTRQTDPGWGPVFFLIKGLVIERGGMLSHGAILAREYGIPAVVGVKDATRRIAPGRLVSVHGDRGLVQLADE